MPDEEGPHEADVASAFVSGLIDAFGGVGTIERRELDEDTVEVAVTGDDLGLLIGKRGQTLSAIQELTWTVVQRKARSNHGRVVVDVSGYRQARREALGRFSSQVAEQVLASGVASVLEPMPAADRKVVHDTVNGIDGVSTSSEGEEPYRRVAITPDAGS